MTSFDDSPSNKTMPKFSRNLKYIWFDYLATLLISFHTFKSTTNFCTEYSVKRRQAEKLWFEVFKWLDRDRCFIFEFVGYVIGWNHHDLHVSSQCALNSVGRVFEHETLKETIDQSPFNDSRDNLRFSDLLLGRNELRRVEKCPAQVCLPSIQGRFPLWCGGTV